MFRGFATLNLYADDLAAARDWYARLFGTEAYFAFPPSPAEPAYVEFRIGDDEDEIGFIDRRYAPPGADNGPGGAVMHWHVDDLEGTLARLVGLGATTYQPITEHGNELGLSPHGDRPLRQRAGHHAQPPLPEGRRASAGTSLTGVPA